MTKRLFFCWLLTAILAMPVLAQIQEPVKFNSELKRISETEAEIVFNAVIDKGWHVYSTELGDDGPISATFNVDNILGAEVDGKLLPQGNEIEEMDPIFEMKVRFLRVKPLLYRK